MDIVVDQAAQEIHSPTKYMVNCVIVILFVVMVCFIDFSEFFLDENSEKLLYYQEDELIKNENAVMNATAVDKANTLESDNTENTADIKQQNVEEERKQIKTENNPETQNDQVIDTSTNATPKNKNYADELFDGMNTTTEDIDVEALARGLVADVQRDAKQH